QPERVRRREGVERLQAERPDAIVIAAYGQLLPRSILEIPPFGCINVHPSLLPRHRGPSPIPAAILAGDEVTGVSIMLLDEGMDSGPLLARAPVPIEPADDARTLEPRLAEVGAGLLEATLRRWGAGEIQAEPQNEDQATFSQLLTRKDGILNWHEPAESLWR